MTRKLSVRFEHALLYAASLHAAQTRKGTAVPYVSHLLAVAALALENGADEDEAIAALLHDAVEDQGGATARAAIAARYGENVASIVEECTDCHEPQKPEWRPRKERYLAGIPGKSPSALLVSACDKLHNARTILVDYESEGPDFWNRGFKGGREGTLWYYRSLVEAFRGRAPAALIRQLDEVVTRLETEVGRVEGWPEVDTA